MPKLAASDLVDTLVGPVFGSQALETRAAKRLATLAVLRAHWSASGETYVDTFLAFALEAVRLEGGVEVPLNVIRERMLVEFGIPIPSAALETMLRGARKKGQGFVRGTSFYPEHASLAEYDTAAARSAAQREQASLIGRVVEAAAAYEASWSDDEAAEAIADYLDRHATSVLATSHGQDMEPDGDSEAESPTEFILANLFASILEREPEAAAYLERLVVGTMLASALFTPDLERITDPLCCDVYLDTPALIDALGHAGEVPARAARESIALLREAGATIKCFDHTVVEIERKLGDVAHQLRDPRRQTQGTDTIVGNAMSRNFSPADLEQSAGRVRSALGSLNIDIVEAPAHNRSTTIDEVAAERILEERLRHTRRNTIRFDLDSLTGIHRIRGAQQKYRIEKCQAIFATPHRRLVTAAREIFPAGRNAPVAIALADLVTLAWLKKPRAMPDFPRLRIAADCYATIQPSAGLVRRYVEEAAKLHKKGAITEDDLYELRYGTESRRILMVKTKGVAAAVDAELVSDVLEERNRQIAAQARRAAERDVNAARAELDREREARESDAAEFALRIGKLEEQSRNQEEMLRNAQAAEHAAIDAKARRLAKWIVRPLAGLLFAAATLIVLLTFPFVGKRVAAPIGLRVLATMPHDLAWIVRAVAIVVAMTLVILNLWGFGFGREMSSIEAKVSRRLRARATGRSHWPGESS